MTSWGNICRVCSSPADYEIFAKIPIYLHGSTNEFLNWQKPINQLIEETTGLKVTTDDNLPRRICAPCISYLKHAVTFRDQVINNALSLKVANIYNQSQKPQKNDNTSIEKPSTSKISRRRHEDKESELITAIELSYIEERPGHNLHLNNSSLLEQQNKVHKQLLNHQHSNGITSGGNYEQQLRYLNVLFDKDPNTGLHPKQRNSNTETTTTVAATATATGGSGSGTGEEEYPTATTSSDDDMGITLDKNFYDYREKNFEEDDIMDLDALRSAVTINIPESCKERKCRACSKRFMFEDSYARHMNLCPEYYFLGFVEEVNRLLQIRKSKDLSPHEYIRRMIFCLRKACEWLKENHVDETLVDLLQQRETEKRQEKLVEEEVKIDSITKTKKKHKSILQTPSTTSNQTTTVKDKPIAEILACIPDDDEYDVKQLFYNSQRKQISGKATPITVENNILYEIERSESRSSSVITKQQHEQPADETAITIPLRPSTSASPAVDRANFIQKLQNALQPKAMTTARAQLTPALAFTARCNPCDLCFDSVTDLELHNAMQHNIAAEGQASELDEHSVNERRRIIALFEDDI